LNKRSKYRIEKDTLGSLSVPKNAYYGIFTVRAKRNFNLTGSTTHPILIKSLGTVKQAAALANMEIGWLDKRKGRAIVRACQEVQAGKFDDQFPLDMLQAGAGTPVNMNANEVIANRAIEILGGHKGDYSVVHPNDHVNMGQSSNNEVPSAVRIGALLLLQGLLNELSALERTLAKKAKEFDKIVKVGRTHLQDAVPIRLGQEFDAYREIVLRGRVNILKSALDLTELGMGGTAVGTGINAHPRFDRLAAKYVSRITGIKFTATSSHVYLTQSMAAFAHFASALEVFCSELIKTCNDLTLLSSGPKAGLHEIILPEVEPGSSIMPGKINPSIVEAFKMVCLQVQGNCYTVKKTASEGNLQLNIFAPLIAHNLFSALEISSRGINMLRIFCIEGIQANTKRIQELNVRSLVTATALNPYIGYARTAELVKESLARNLPLKTVLLEKKWFEKKELETILDPHRLTSPQDFDKNLQKKVALRLKKAK
jgi:aspartate ammonia-lyase